jgi:predicted PurR-regulated permease PerM
MRLDKKTRMILAIFAGLLGLAIWGLGSAKWPVLISFGLAYLFFPIIQKVEKFGIGRQWAIGGVFLISTLVNIGFLIAVIPGVVTDLKAMVSEFPQSVDLAIEQVLRLISWLGIPLQLDNSSIKLYLNQHLQEISSTALNTLTSGFSIAFSGLTKWIFSLVNIFLIPIFFFYFVNDFELIIAEIESFIPPSVRESVHNYINSINQILRGYLRGQLMVALILAVLYSVGLSIVGVRFGFLIGLLTGLLSFIPYVGFLTGLILSLVMALANWSGIPHLIGIAVVFGLIQVLESFLITPKLVGNSVGLSPLIILLALLIGANVLGLFGMLLAVPTAAFFKIVLNDLKEEYQET